MIFQFNNVVALYAITASILGLVGAYYWKRRDLHGAYYLALLMFAAMIWSSAEVLEMAAVDPSLKVLFGKISYIGVVSVAPLWLMFNMAYSQRRNVVDRKDSLLLWIVPAIVLILVSTNDWHQLFWVSITPVSTDPGAVLIYSYGIAAYLNMIYIYSIMLAATLILLQTSLRTVSQNFLQTIAVILGGLVPLAGNFIYFFATGASSGIDPTPMFIAFMGLFYVICTSYLKLFDLVPLARARLFVNMLDGILVIDGRDRIIDFNPAAAAIVGTGLTIGSPLEVALAGQPDLRECCRMQDGTREVRAEPLWLELRVTPVLDYGEATGRVAILRNITKRKHAEEALEKSEQKFRVYTETTAVATLVYQEDGITYANQYCQRLTGYTSAELLGKSVADIVHPRNKEMADTISHALLMNTALPTRYEIQFLTKTSETRWAYISLGRIVDGGRPAIILTAIDTTDRKNAEEQLKDSEDRFRSVFEQSTNGILLMDAQGSILLFNHGAEFITGITAADAIGRPLWEIEWQASPRDLREKMTTEQMKAGFSEYFEEVFAEGTVMRSIDIERPDGSRRITQSAIFPITSTKGQMIGVIMRDVTEQVAAEQQLEAERQELKRSNEELEQFASIASHDLQEPLRMVNSYVKLLDRKYKGQLDEKADQYIDFMIDGTQRMQQMIKDLLKYSRVGGRDLAMVPVNLGTVMDIAMIDLDAAIRESGAEVRYGILPRVIGDEGQLRHVLENLVGNAIKFRCSDRKPIVYVEATRQGRFWEIAVRDNGIGIDPQYFCKIFVIFQRLHTREEYAGTGIGLALCKKIVERLGGTIRVESTPGEGSTFYFTLPVAE